MIFIANLFLLESLGGGVVVTISGIAGRRTDAIYLGWAMVKTGCSRSALLNVGRRALGVLLQALIKQCA